MNKLVFFAYSMLLLSCSGPQKKASAAAEKDELVVTEMGNEVAKEVIDEIPIQGTQLDDQSFEVTLRDFGKVEFITTISNKVNFYLARDGVAFYEFPRFETEGWQIDEVIAIGFPDLNADGKKDVIVMTNWITGVGPSGVIPFPINKVYLKDGENFVLNKPLNEKLSAMDLKTLSAIRKFVRTELAN